MSPDVIIGMDEAFDDTDFDHSLEFPKPLKSPTSSVISTPVKGSPVIEKKNDSSPSTPAEFVKSLIWEIVDKIGVN